MSLNQSRSEKNESRFRKPGGGRSGSSSGGPQRTFSGGRGRGGGGGAGPTTPTAPPVSTNQSFKKNAQGGQSRANVGPVNTLNSDSGTRSVENGVRMQSSLHGMSNTPVAAGIPKPADPSPQKSSRPLPRAPSSQSSSVNSNSTLPSTPAKGDGAKGFPLQFGSISPGFMNGMQVPARTSSAPPNLDEQKHDQARRDASRAVPEIPLPSASKQELPKKDVALTSQPVTQQTNTEIKAKRDVQVASASPPTQTQKPSAVPMAGISVQLPYHQPTVAVQFGGANPKIQSQGMPTNSLQMPLQMPLQMGNPSQVPQQVFVPGLQHPPLIQTQGIMHQGQNLSFNPPLGTQLPHQLGNLGMNMSTQFNQQQAGKFGSVRKTVKITHPETHEELRLDSMNGGASGSRSHQSGPLQSQPLPTYTATHPMGYYSNSYTAGPPFFPGQSSLPLMSSQLNVSSQGPRFSYSVSQAPPTMSVMNQPSSNTFPVRKGGASVRGTPDSSALDHIRDAQNIVPSAQSTSTTVTVKEGDGSAGEVLKSTAAEKPETSKLLNPAVEPGVVKDSEVNTHISSMKSKSVHGHSKQSAPMPDSVTPETSNPATSSAVPNMSSRESSNLPTHVDTVNSEAIIKPTSIRGVQDQSGEKGHSQPSPQVDGQSDSKVLQELGNSSKIVAFESAEAKNSQISSGLKEVVSETVQKLPMIVVAGPSDLGAERLSYSSESYETRNVVDRAAKNHHAKQSDLQEKMTRVSADTKERGEKELVGELQSDSSLKGSYAVKETDQDGELKKVGHVNGMTEASQREAESANSCIEDNKMVTKNSSIEYDSSIISDGCSISDSNASSGEIGSLSCEDINIPKFSMSDNEAAPVSADLSEANLGHEGEVNSRPSSSSGNVSGSSITSMEPNKTKNKGKKKLKEMLQKADALGTTSDLYVAYKGPEAKKETLIATKLPSEADSKEVSAKAKLEESAEKNKDVQSKTELDDWEDAADISTPKLESSHKVDYGGALHNGVTTKKYSRDFLLTFLAQYTDLPENFEIPADIADALMCVNVNASRTDREYTSPGRNIDRPAGAARSDRRGSGTMDTDRWNKQPGAYPSVRDPGMDLAYGNAMGFPTGPGPNYGVLRNPRVQGSVQHAGGILSGPMRSMGFQGLHRNNSDADRWQRATGFHKGLMPAPQAPSQVMHKAEKKYEVGKINDEEGAKQRRLKGILNKLTPQNFERLFEQVKEVNIDNAVTLRGVISQIFDKALTEPTFCEMYANFCYHLASELPELSEGDEKITFRRLLLNKCQEEFEREEREEQEAKGGDNEGEGETKQSEEEREEKRLKARRRMLGNIRLIGELYKKKMLTERIMHECIKKLLGTYQNPDEEDIEALCKLMSTIGEMIDHSRAKEHMDAYFDIMGQLSNNMKLSSRVRFMLKDAIDLRKNKWQQRRKVEGPKKIEEVHRDAAQERQGQVGRLSRGPSMNPVMRRGQPAEFGPRGAMLSPPAAQGGGLRGMPSQVRGYGGQDVRIDERNMFESRTLSVPLPQRPSSDDPITLQPQGGLGRGMAFRGQPLVSSSPLLENSPSFGDSRRMVGGLNGYSNASDRGVYNSREDHFARNASERFGAPVAYDQFSRQELNVGHTNRDVRYSDRNLDRSRPITPPVARAGTSSSQNVSSERALSEEQLQDMSIAAIKEYYSAKDEKEVALCIGELNAPSFYPTVISIWVTDSFERKDMERDMLSKLLVNLTKPGEGIFNPGQLTEGFKSVLTNLEDTVTDAPKAPEFLGRMFGRVVIENLIPLKDVGRLIQDGGEEPGSLREAGLAAEVLGSALETIKSEKGESVLNEIRARSNLRLDDFRPPDPMRCRKLEMFM